MASRATAEDDRARDRSIDNTVGLNEVKRALEVTDDLKVRAMRDDILSEDMKMRPRLAQAGLVTCSSCYPVNIQQVAMATKEPFNSSKGMTEQGQSFL